MAWWDFGTKGGFAAGHAQKLCLRCEEVFGSKTLSLHHYRTRTRPTPAFHLRLQLASVLQHASGLSRVLLFSGFGGASTLGTDLLGKDL